MLNATKTKLRETLKDFSPKCEMKYSPCVVTDS